MIIYKDHWFTDCIGHLVQIWCMSSVIQQSNKCSRFLTYFISANANQNRTDFQLSDVKKHPCAVGPRYKYKRSALSTPDV